jgi:hypothetical protein
VEASALTDYHLDFVWVMGVRFEGVVRCVEGQVGFQRE